VIADSGMLPWLACVREAVPDVEPLDAHTHIGFNDPDGFSCSGAELMSSLEGTDARAFVFPMHEPEGYPAANDMVIEEAGRSGGRLFPFARLDPHDDALAEAERALERGARGIKLHPRAEQFTLDHPGLDPVLALANERRLPVLVHAGRGIPALGRHAVEACSRYPDMRLILAHAGISDLAWIWRVSGDHPNLFFDTSWWSPSDLQALLALVAPGQILMASDAPYGSPTWATVMTARNALQAGLDAEQTRAVLGTQALRIVNGEDRLDVGPAPGAGRLSRDALLDRVYSFLIMSIGQMFQGIEPEETLALARLACDVGDDAPQAAVCRWVVALLDERVNYSPEGDGRPARFAPGMHFVVAALGIVRTPDVPVPEFRPAPAG
jgi:predicted TIM-barrel fold metal-dependent hydrolase